MVKSNPLLTIKSTFKKAHEKEQKLLDEIERQKRILDAKRLQAERAKRIKLENKAKLESLYLKEQRKAEKAKRIIRRAEALRAKERQKKIKKVQKVFKQLGF